MFQVPPETTMNYTCNNNEKCTHHKKISDVVSKPTIFQQKPTEMKKKKFGNIYIFNLSSPPDNRMNKLVLASNCKYNEKHLHLQPRQGLQGNT